MILFLVVFSVLVATGFAVASAISDFKSMTIPNAYAAGIILAFIPAYAADALGGAAGLQYFAGWQSHLLAAVIVFAITFVLFFLQMVGAGDSKLGAAMALWVSMPGLAPFLFYMALTGAVLALFTKLLNKKTVFPNAPEGSWIARAQGGYQGLPYGIAICVGAIIAFWQLGYFSLDRLGALAGYTEN